MVRVGTTVITHICTQCAPCKTFLVTKIVQGTGKDELPENQCAFLVRNRIVIPRQWLDPFTVVTADTWKRQQTVQRFRQPSAITSHHTAPLRSPGDSTEMGVLVCRRKHIGQSLHLRRREAVTAYSQCDKRRIDIGYASPELAHSLEIPSFIPRCVFQPLMQFPALLNLEDSLVRRRRIGIRNVGSVYAALLNKSPLQIRNVDSSRRDTAHRSLRRRQSCRISNILHIRLHAQDGHRITVGTHAEPCHQQTVNPFRKETAVWHVGMMHISSFTGAFHEKDVTVRLTVRIEIGFRDAYRITVAATCKNIERRYAHLTQKTPPFTGIAHLAHIPCAVRHRQPRTQEKSENILRTRFIHKSDIGIHPRQS